MTGTRTAMGSIRRTALSGIRPRLALLSLMASAPLTVLLLVSAVAERDQAVGLAASRARDLAVLGAGQQADMIDEARTLLRVLARVPDVRSPGSPRCHALLQQVAADHQRILTLAVASADGRVGCASQDIPAGLSVADRPYFTTVAAARTDDMILSTVMSSRTTGKAIIAAVVPLFPPDAQPQDGRPAAADPDMILVATLNLDWLNRLAVAHSGTDGNLVQVVDLRDGKLLAGPLAGGAKPDGVGQAGGGRIGTGQAGAAEAGPGQAGAAQADAALAAAARAAKGSGMMEGPDPLGVARITGFAPLPGTGGNLVLSVGFPRSKVLSAAGSRLTVNAALAVATTCMALLAAALLGRRSLVTPLRRMVQVARRLGAGDLAARTGRLDDAAQELQMLAAGLNDMGARMQARSGELATAQAGLLRSEEHHRLLSTYSSDMISRFDASFQLTYVSPACLDLTGYDPEELTGRPPTALVHPEDLSWTEETLYAPLQAGKEGARATYRVTRKDGALVWMESIGRRLPAPGGAGGCVMVTRDVSARIEMEQNLQDANRLLRGQAMQDPLTALANRRHVDEALGVEFRRAQRLQLPLGLLMLDIDRFKAFNDTYGHPAGDACIRAVAAAVAAVLRRPTDLAGRYGGEEFAILLPNTDEAGVAVTGERIRRGVQELRLSHAGSEFGIVTVSIGGAVIMPAASDSGPAAFVEAADAALYGAKRAGRNGLRLAAVAHGASGPLPALQPDQPTRPPGLRRATDQVLAKEASTPDVGRLLP